MNAEKTQESGEDAGGLLRIEEEERKKREG